MRPVIRDLAPSYQVPTTVDIYDGQVLYTLTNEYGEQPISKSSQFWTYATNGIRNFMADCVVANKDAEKWGGLSSGYIYTMNYLINNIFGDGDKIYGYQNARLSLIGNFGQYCSYCGMPVLDSSLAVEHMLPKSVFPDVMMCYPNFLLACPNCNSDKSAEPKYSDALTWAKKTNFNPNYNQIKDGGYLYAIWPDNRDIPAGTPINDDAYMAFSLALYELDEPNNQWKIINKTNGMDLDNKWINIQKNVVWANVLGYTGPLLTGTYFTADGPANIKERAQDMIDMVDFDSVNSTDKKMTNRRLLNRTITFFEALAAFRRLQLCYNQDKSTNKDLYEFLCQQVFTTARYSGFYEVWIMVFRYWSQQGGITIQGVYTFFKNQTCNPGNPSAYFPGTYPNSLPK